MTEAILIIVSLLLLIIIFLRRYYLMEKGYLFGKMVLKKAFALPKKLVKEDHEITADEMIPEEGSLDPKLVLKGNQLFKKSELALKRGLLDDAEKLLIKTLSLNPSLLEAHAKLGALYLNLKQYSKAELIYRKLVLAINNDPVYFSNLGLCLFQQEKYAEAKEFYEKAVEMDDTRAGRFYSLARINHLLNDWDAALFNIQKALNLDPDNLDYGLTLAHWYLEKDIVLDAKQLLENILKHWPDNEEALAMMRELK